MSLKEQLNVDLKEALRAKDQVRLNVLRQIKTLIATKETEAGRVVLNDEAVLGIVQTLSKQRRESIEQFTQGGRDDLVKNEQAELKILETYLPKQLDDSALAALVDEVISAEGASSVKDLGKVMKAVLAKTAGQADGKRVSALVKEKLL